MKLSIATNWTDDLVEALEPFPVKELFGSLSRTPIGGGRPSMFLPDIAKDAAERHIRKVLDRGWGFNYVLNALCVSAEAEAEADVEAKLYDHLRWLDGLGVPVITAAHPLVLFAVKKHFPHIKVKISIIPDLDTVTKVHAFEKMGADEIGLSIMANRDFDFLERVIDAVQCELTLLVNQACLYMCPDRLYHGSINAHASTETADDPGFGAAYCLVKCSIQKLSHPVHLIKSPWIRPEDLPIYERLGFHTFKIAGREMDTPWLVNAARAYSDRSFDGNAAEILNGIAVMMAAGGPDTRMLPFIDNRRLDGFLHQFTERRCTRNCVGCGFCEAIAKDAVELHSDKNARFVETLKTIARGIVQ